MAMWAAGPPKASVPSLRKTKANSGRETGAFVDESVKAVDSVREDIPFSAKPPVAEAE